MPRSRKMTTLGLRQIIEQKKFNCMSELMEQFCPSVNMESMTQTQMQELISCFMT